MSEIEGIPNILYKYRDYSNEFNRRTLLNFELFLASTTMFNDPYEGAIPFAYDPVDLTYENIFLKLRELAIKEHPKWTEAQIQEYCYEGQQKDLLNDDAHIARFNEENRKAIDETFGILSLTIHPKNYLMWSHYSNSHIGFCLGFDKKILFETVGGALGPVSYVPNVPKLRLFGDIVDFHKKQLATKSDIWSYEDEFRIIKSYAAKQKIIYPKEMLKEIYLGCKLPFSEKQKIIEFVRQKEIDCQIFELSLDKNRFELNELRIY